MLASILIPGQLHCFSCIVSWIPGLSAGAAPPAKGTVYSTAAWSVISGSHAGLCSTGQATFSFKNMLGPPVSSGDHGEGFTLQISKSIPALIVFEFPLIRTNQGQTVDEQQS